MKLKILKNGSKSLKKKLTAVLKPQQYAQLKFSSTLAKLKLCGGRGSWIYFNFTDADFIDANFDPVDFKSMGIKFE